MYLGLAFILVGNSYSVFLRGREYNNNAESPTLPSTKVKNKSQEFMTLINYLTFFTYKFISLQHPIKRKTIVPGPSTIV